METLYQTWFLMPNWKWLTTILAVLIGLILLPILRAITVQLKTMKNDKNGRLKFLSFFRYVPIEKPFSLLVLFVLWAILLDTLSIDTWLDKYLGYILKFGISIQILRLIYQSIDALGTYFKQLSHNVDNKTNYQLINFGTKSLKIISILFGILLMLQNFGINVVSVMAGLGIGSLAVVLAAQETVANLFGSITILVDSPFKVGDWIKITDTEGTVEEIGFRSTRIRTFYNSIVTIPNSIVAKEKIDNLGVRPNKRIRQVLGIDYSTQPERIEEFCNQIRTFLKQSPEVQKDTILVNFNQFGSSTLDVLVNFHIDADTLEKELERQQFFFLRFIQIAKNLQIEFAFPTQTVFYKSATAEPG